MIQVFSQDIHNMCPCRVMLPLTYVKLRLGF